ncbi:unnamed protein product [Moneuplotes crassus]|uniref:Uncharacterized protein n=1 Tax=Euplotes crassus TaxID=5936 RepID=A0AAD1U961_EUPCR|nr:unnamed protein product [Moneuplotes crassus]
MAKLFRVNRGRKLRNSRFDAKSFIVKKRKPSKLNRKQKSFSITSPLRERRRRTRKTMQAPRVHVKSPPPTFNSGELLSPLGLDLEQEKERYMTIIMKAQNALRNNSRVFGSPCVLKKFLSERRSFKSQGNVRGQSFISEGQEASGSGKSKKFLDKVNIRKLNITKKSASFTAKNMTS